LLKVKTVKLEKVREKVREKWELEKKNGYSTEIKVFPDQVQY